jgi:mannan endo-1,4-beta-mannosidase
VCVPLCTEIMDPALDPQGDDWGWENGGSCIIPTTATASNDACTTGETLPPPAPRPGVVTRNTGGERECTAVCQFYTSPTQPGANADGFADDWAYENNATCVIPNTQTAATSLACTTGEPVPESPPRPGVVVASGVGGELTCIALCTFFTTPTQPGANGDNLGDDWAYENSDSCIIPGTLTASNTPCTTGEAVPPPEPRPGIMVNSDPLEDSCLTSACVPLCRVVTVGADPAYPDWGWEDNTSCVIPGSTTATLLPKSEENHGYAVPPRACTWGAPPVDVMAPPALDATRVVQNYFKTDGAVLRDPYGQPFLIRGVNNSHGWYDICGQYAAYEALDNIAAAGANAVRVGWAFESIDPVGPDMGEEEKPVIGTNAQLLAEILHRIVELQMVPILALNDSTGQTDTEWPHRMAQFITAPGYKEVMLAYEAYLLIGIANEWNGTQFSTAYTQAVTYFREQGINHTLVVTANDWGQGCQAILDFGGDIIDADPLDNVLFDMHIYNYLNYGNCRDTTGVCGSAEIVSGCLNAIASAGLPLLVGEFGGEHGGDPVAWEAIVQTATAQGQGMTPWLWYGDTEYPALNMNDAWEGPLSSWGSSVVPQVFTGAKASIFQ